MHNQYCKNYLMHTSKNRGIGFDQAGRMASEGNAKMLTGPSAYSYDMLGDRARIDAANKMVSEGNAKTLAGPPASAVKRVKGQQNRRRMLALGSRPDDDTSAGSTIGAIKSAYKSLIGPDGKLDKKKYNAMYYELHKARWAPGGIYYEAAQKVKRALTGGQKKTEINVMFGEEPKSWIHIHSDGSITRGTDAN